MSGMLAVEAALLDHLPNKEGRNMVAMSIVIFIPGDNQQAVIRLGPLSIRIQVIFEPGIARRDAAIVHVIVQIGIDDADGWQLVEIRRKI